MKQFILLSSTWAKPLTKFNPKMQDFKCVLDVNCKRGIEQFNFSIGFQMLKIAQMLKILSNGSKHVRNVIQWH